MIVTAVDRQPRRRRVNVFVDGRFALAIGRELAAERGVRPGVAISREELAALELAEARRSALESALRLLSYRARSRYELRDRLKRKEFPTAVIDETLRRLQEMGYIDDAAFARAWKETRQAAQPRSSQLLISELRLRGIPPRMAEEATADVSDEEAAYEAARRRLRTLRGLAQARFRERLGAFLTRRGFSYDVSRRTIERCWAELSCGQDGEEAIS